MNKIYNPTRNTWSKLLQRPTANFNDIEETVKGIFKEVQTKGDEAIAKYTSLFDGISIANIEVSKR
jgi:histidinol dehydrogenase